MKSKSGILALLFSLACALPAMATFHLMQIEQVIGGLDGDTSAQAIQLRMRDADQDEVSRARIRAWDSAGLNPVMVLDMAADMPVRFKGSRVLLATSSFTAKVRATTPSFTPDFVMALPIPPAYLAAGRLTYENDSGQILWSLAWGGPSYTGNQIGAVFNDLNGNFGPAFPRALPSAHRRALRFDGPAGAFSTSNSLDYGLSPNPATVKRNDGKSFLIGPVPEIVVEQPAGNRLKDNWNKVDFGEQKIGEDSKPLTFTIRNTGRAPLRRLAVNKNGDEPNDYTISQPVKTTLAAGETTTFEVIFTPHGRRLRQALIHIRSNDSNESPFDIEVSGKGTK